MATWRALVAGAVVAAIVAGCGGGDGLATGPPTTTAGSAPEGPPPTLGPPTSEDPGVAWAPQQFVEATSAMDPVKVHGEFREWVGGSGGSSNISFTIELDQETGNLTGLASADEGPFSFLVHDDTVFLGGRLFESEGLLAEDEWVSGRPSDFSALSTLFEPAQIWATLWLMAGSEDLDSEYAMTPKGRRTTFTFELDPFAAVDAAPAKYRSLVEGFALSMGTENQGRVVVDKDGRVVELSLTLSAEFYDPSVDYSGGYFGGWTSSSRRWRNARSSSHRPKVAPLRSMSSPSSPSTCSTERC